MGSSRAGLYRDRKVVSIVVEQQTNFVQLNDTALPFAVRQASALPLQQFRQLGEVRRHAAGLVAGQQDRPRAAGFLIFIQPGRVTVGLFADALERQPPRATFGRHGPFPGM